MQRLAVTAHSLRVYARHPLLLYFYAPALLFSVARAMVLLALPLYAKTFEVSYGVIGLVLACLAIGTMIGDIPAGMLLRRWGVRTVMQSGLGLFALAMTVQVIAPSIWIVAAGQLIAGLGQAMFAVSQHITITETIALEKRGRAISVLGGVFRVGGFAGPALAGAVAATYGLRIAFWPVVALVVIALVLVFRYLPESNGQRVVIEHPGAHLRAMLAAHWRVLAAGGTGFMLAMIVRQGRSAILPLYGTDVVGLDEVQIGLIMSLVSAVDMVLFPLAGVLMDRFGRKWAIVPSFIIQATGMLLIAVSGSFVELLAAGMLIGLGNGISAGTMMTVGADLAPENARGEFLGVWRLVGDMGSAGGPLVVGGIADVLALPSAAVALSVAGLLAASVFVRFVPETLKTRAAT